MFVFSVFTEGTEVPAVPGKFREDVLHQRPERQQLPGVLVRRRQRGKRQLENGNVHRRDVRQEPQAVSRLWNRVPQPLRLPSVHGDVSRAGDPATARPGPAALLPVEADVAERQHEEGPRQLADHARKEHPRLLPKPHFFGMLEKVVNIRLVAANWKPWKGGQGRREIFETTWREGLDGESADCRRRTRPKESSPSLPFCAFGWSTSTLLPVLEGHCPQLRRSGGLSQVPCRSPQGPVCGLGRQALGPWRVQWIS